MTTYTNREVRTARRFLVATGKAVADMSDESIMVTALQNGWECPTASLTAPSSPVQTAPAAVQIDLAAPATDAAAAFAALLATMAPAVDEKKIIELIKTEVSKSITPVTTLEVTAPNAPKVTIKSAHKELKRVVARLHAGYHVYLYGPAGAGKTTLASQAATALGLDFCHTGALMQKYELTGYNDANGNFISTTFYDAYKNGKLFLFDEADASNPTALIAFNGAIANGEMTFPNGLVKMHTDFKCIAAANTNGQGATQNYKRQALDGATLDRFIKITLAYDEALEKSLAVAEYARLGGDDNDTALGWIRLVQSTRADAKRKKINAIISPRASILGAGVLAMGGSKTEAIEETFGAGLSDDQRKQLGV